MEHAHGFDVIWFGLVILQSSAVTMRYDLSRYYIQHCDDSDRMCIRVNLTTGAAHDDVIQWKHFPRYWPFVPGIHRSPVNSPYKGQWRGALMLPLICVLINGWVNKREADDLRRYRAHYDVTAMTPRPDGWAMGCLCEDCGENWLRYNVLIWGIMWLYT